MNKLLFFIGIVILAYSCSNNYGKKVRNGHIETYYQDGISTGQAERVATFLYETDKENGNDTNHVKSTQLIKNGDTISFRMVIQKEKYKDMYELEAEDTSASGKQLKATKVQDADFLFLVLGNIISDSVFSGKPVNVDLTDNKFKT